MEVGERQPTPDPLEAAIVAWVPPEAVRAALVGGRKTMREILAAYQHATAPLLARAVEAALDEMDVGVGSDAMRRHAHAAFRAALEESK